MNLVKLDARRIAGSDVDTGIDAPMLGIRPEQIRLDERGIPAVVQSVEYLGADLVLRCLVGSETVLVRATGQHLATAGEHVSLAWSDDHAHGFDVEGRCIPRSQPSKDYQPCNAEDSLAKSRAA
jgi:sn-glycerol 3-phosphate transport system ATP-binding protein